MGLMRALMAVATMAWAGSEVLRPRRPQHARWLFTLALLITLVHVIVAFEAVYRWDHALAVSSTARQAAAKTGWEWRGSLYVNYAFLTVWLADVGWWWIAPHRYRQRSPTLDAVRLALFVFMFFNAAVVFATVQGQVVGTTALGVVVVDRLSRRRALPPGPSKAESAP